MMTRQNIIEDVFENINTVVRCDIKKFQQLLVNVSSGDKLLSYAVFCAACVKGIETFIINSKYSDSPVIIPVLKFPYSKIITPEEVIELLLLQLLLHLWYLVNFSLPHLIMRGIGTEDSILFR